LGDLSEFPYYHRKAHQRELIICAEWLSRLDCPIVYDVGANTGFFVTQLAQMTRNKAPHFYAFEAIPQTFSMLRATIRRLGLEQTIEPISVAVLDRAGRAQLKCYDRNSLLARVVADAPTESADTISVDAVTLDSFCEATGTIPSFLKIDVEGAEPAVLRGAKCLLARNRPAVLFEYNPGSGSAELSALLRDGPLNRYRLYFEGQLLEFGSPVDNCGSISWICNLFAVPEECIERWCATIAAARQRL
jgi:FkbM family methyltransferase